MQYFTSLHEIDPARAILLIEASIQAYHAFSESAPTVCQRAKVTPPPGYDLIDSWTGVDDVFNEELAVECYGVVFRSTAAPFTYIFAFRGTASIFDFIDDLWIETRPFVPCDTTVPAAGAEVESGLFDVYCKASGHASMQTQLFALVDKYNASDHPIGQLYITGHSLGAALSQLFTLDVALSRPDVAATTYSYAGPCAGDPGFVALYEQQPAQQHPETRTVRFQNTYDKVPCVPLKRMGFAHTSPACLVAFYKHSWDGIDLDFIVNDHSPVNYRAVLQGAAKSSTGVCVGEVEGDGYKLTSKAPKTKEVCSWWL